jgi:hypothetical protein
MPVKEKMMYGGKVYTLYPDAESPVKGPCTGIDEGGVRFNVSSLLKIVWVSLAGITWVAC